MAKTIQVNLQFNANTANAKNAVQQLQNQLTALSQQSTLSNPLGITPQLQQAEQSAMRLKMALNNAFNQDTGKLNLNKFQAELKSSGMSLKTLAADMRALGPAGVQAFSQLTQQIVAADTRMFSLQGKAKALVDQFGSAMKWTIAYGAINKMTQSISNAVSYVKELDTSLNNIRIVTGKSAEQMESFAKTANNMAKSLSTTTKTYSDASLIYYQQGLNDSEVKKRTDVTVKLANATGESAQQVSEWMTAIWNNFDDGSEKLDYYADVLAKLGATTASSADEIATGLEKFSAVADTVGLSYEYAASALATITAETRQSADVVGTSLKTLFARIEGLKFGDTLEDGTTLNQYSLALQKIGVDIKDANGELKDMDIILDQTGARWSTLSKDQQVALAQSVAGIRQYTQFMALMDNWDVMQENLKTTEAANGALEEQQRIYEESIAAAEKRMSAAGEKLKSTIIGSDELTPLYDFGAGALEVIAEIFEAFGGLETILYGVVAALTKMYQPQLTSFFNQMGTAASNTAQKMAYFFTLGKKGSANPMQDYKNEVLDLNSQMLANQGGDREGILNSKFSKEQADIQRMLLEYQNKLTDAQKQEFQWRLQILEIQQKQALEAAKTADEAQRTADASKEQGRSGNHMTSQEVETFGAKASNYGKALQSGNNALSIFENIPTDAKTKPTIEQRNEIIDSVHGHMSYSGKAYQDMGIKMDSDSGLASRLKTEIASIDKEAFSQKMQSIENGGAGLNAYEAALDQIEQEFLEGGTSVDQFRQKIEQLNQIMQQYGSSNMEEAIRTAFAGAIEDPQANRAFNMANLRDNASIEDINNALNTGTETEPLKEGSRAQELANEGAAIASDKEALIKAETEYNQILEKVNKTKASGRKVSQKELDQLNQAKKTYDQTTKQVGDLDKRTESLAKKVKRHGNELRKNNIATKKANKTTEELKKESGDAAQSIDEMTQAHIKAGKAEANHDAQTNNLNKSTDKLKGTLASAATDTGGFAKNLASGISQMATYAMGVNMLTSAFENLFSAIGSGNVTMGDAVSSLSSILMSMTMLIPVILSATTAYKNKVKVQQEENQAILIEYLTKKKGMDAEKAKILVSKLSQKETRKEADESLKAAGAEVIEGYAGVAKQAGQGPKGWVTAAISAAMIAPIAVMALGSAIGGFSGGSKEAKQEEVSKGTESLEAINENQELTETVTDLTEEYNALRNAGESTADVLENMRDKIPELIDSYKELAKTMGTHIDTSGLEKAYEVFEKTGDITLFQKEKEKLDKEIKDKEKTTAQNTMNKARELVTEAASSGVGDGYFGDQYGTDLGSISGDDEKIFEDALGDYYKESEEGIRFNLTDSGELVDVYEGMLKARSELEKKYSPDELKNLEYYNKLNEEIKEMSENMPDVINAQQALFDIEKEDALKDEQAFNSKIGLGSIGSVEEFEANKDKLIAKIQEETEWTKAQAEAYLMATNAYGGYAEATDFFSEDGLGFNKDANEQTIKEIKEWFADLPEEERTLAMTIDYTIVGNVEEAKAALDKAREKAAIATAYKEAEALGVEIETLEAYTDILMDNNTALEDNKVVAAKVAAATAKLNKGIESLQKNWKKNYQAIKSGNKATLEYAESIGNVQTSLKEAFGVKPSVKFIENNLGLISELAAGNVESLDKLQSALAQDYVANMVINDFSINENEVYGSAEKVRNTLQQMLSDMDMNISLGKNTIIDDSYFEAMQQMIDSGQITEEQLNSMLSAKGYQLEVTGRKKIKGPEKTITRTITRPGEEPVTETIEEQEWIDVPIINGRTDEISDGSGGTKSNLTSGSANKAKLVRTTNKTSVNFSNTAAGGGGAGESAEDRKKRQRELNDEVDRYHEIEEVLDDISKLQDKISKAKDRAFGAKKVALINAEVKALEAQEKALDKNIEKAKNYLELDKKEAAKYGLKFDAATGNLTNYEELQQKYLNKLGSMSKDDSNYEKVQAEYEAFEAAAKKYEETYDTWEDKMEQKAENIRAQLDAKLEGVSYSIELKYKINDRELARAERTLERLQRDEDYDRAKGIVAIGQSTGAAEKDLKAAQQGLRETLEVAKVNKKDIEAYMAGNADALAKYDLDSNVIEKVEEYTDKALDAYATIEENEQSMLELISDNFDYWHEKVSAIGEKLESYQGIMENYTNIVDLVGAKTLGISNNMLKQMEKATMQAAQAQVSNAKAVMDTTKAALDEAKAAAANTELPIEEREAYEKQVETLEAQLLEDTANFTNVWASTIELAYETFDKETQRAIEEFGKTLTNGFGSMQEYVDEFEWQQEKDDWFVEGYEKAYELSKLTRDLNKQLDKTQSVKNQKMLAEFQEEIAAYQKAGVEMSEHDLDILRKRYDLKLAEIALEEAQNAKSTVRLQRDSEGNYGYVYTADQNNIDQAQQNYEDKLFAMQQSNDQYLNDLQSKVVTNRQEMVNALANLNYSDYANAEAYEKAKNEIIERYSAREQYLLQEMQKTIDYNTLVYNNDVLNYGSYVGQHEAISNEWVMHFRDITIAQMGDGYEDLRGFHEKLNEALGNVADGSGLLGQTAAAMDDLEAHIEKIFEEAGLDINTFKDTTKAALNGDSDSASASLKTFEEHMLEVMYGKGGSANKPSSDSVVGGIKAAEDATKKYAEDAKKSFPAISQEVSTWYKTYGPTLQKGKEDTENLDSALTSLFEKEDWKISAGVEISSADIKAVEELTKALSNLTKEVNNMSSQAININVNYKTGSSSTPPHNNGGNTKLSPTQIKKMQDWVLGKDKNALPKFGADSSWGEETDNALTTAFKNMGLSYDFGNNQASYEYWEKHKDDIVMKQTQPKYKTEQRIKIQPNSKIFQIYYTENGVFGPHNIDKGYAIISNDKGQPIYETTNKGKFATTSLYIEEVKKINGTYFYKIGKKQAENYSDLDRNNNINNYLGQYWLAEHQIIGTYDTGGYTGEWGPEGRLAMLHQKEIVLNAHDTENFLTAIEIVRSIANQMNLNNQKLSEYATSSTRLPKTQTETLQQEVTIHAEFPNATNHNEIEEAFGNLVNLAAQYTNRK